LNPGKTYHYELWFSGKVTAGEREPVSLTLMVLGDKIQDDVAPLSLINWALEKPWMWNYLAHDKSAVINKNPIVRRSGTAWSKLCFQLCLSNFGQDSWLSEYRIIRLFRSWLVAPQKCLSETKSHGACKFHL
jgi:hypothetical protein